VSTCFAEAKEVAENIRMMDGSWRAGSAGAEARQLFHDAFGPAEAVPLLQSSSD
jgi:hypothetical protein